MNEESVRGMAISPGIFPTMQLHYSTVGVNIMSDKQRCMGRGGGTRRGINYYYEDRIGQLIEIKED